MGTSQSHILKTGPNWSEAKRAITSIAKNTGEVNSNCKKLMHGFSNALSENPRASGSLGHAGARVSKNFITFIELTKRNRYSDILELLNVPNEKERLTKEDFIEKVIVYVSGDHDSTPDDAAAIIAIEKLLNDAFTDCVTPHDITEKLQNASNDSIVEWIIRFEVEYILEYCSEIFQSHILDKSDDPERVISEIRNWMYKEIDDKLGDQLQPHDFTSPDGNQILDELTTDILNIWKQ